MSLVETLKNNTAHVNRIASEEQKSREFEAEMHYDVVKQDIIEQLHLASNGVYPILRLYFVPDEPAYYLLEKLAKDLAEPGLMITYSEEVGFRSIKFYWGT
jgi:hypothetical protein